MIETPLRDSSFTSSLRRYWAWAQKGSWVVMDQALFAGANFLGGLMLARWLTPTAYGAFSTAYTVFLLVGTLHNALWIDPMTVYGSGRFRENYIEYQRILLNYHWRFGVVAFGVFALIGAGLLALGQGALGRSFLGLAIASSLILFLWLARRGAYVAMMPRLATYGGVLYLVLYLGMTAALERLNWLNETSALVTMGLASWISGRWILIYGRRATMSSIEISPVETASLHWEYGRWALLSAFFSWAPANLLFLLLPFFENLDNVGGLRAMLTIFQPPIQVNSALSAMLVTIYATLASSKSKKRLTLVAASALGALNVIYCALIILFGHQIVTAIMPRYDGYVDVFKFPLAILTIFTAFIGVFMSFFKSLEKPQTVTRVMLFAAIFSAILSATILPLGGAVGAAWVMTATYALITFNFFWRWTREA